MMDMLTAIAAGDRYLSALLGVTPERALYMLRRLEA